MQHQDIEYTLADYHGEGKHQSTLVATSNFTCRGPEHKGWSMWTVFFKFDDCSEEVDVLVNPLVPSWMRNMVATKTALVEARGSFEDGWSVGATAERYGLFF